MGHLWVIPLQVIVLAINHGLLENSPAIIRPFSQLETSTAAWGISHVLHKPREIR